MKKQYSSAFRMRGAVLMLMALALVSTGAFAADSWHVTGSFDYLGVGNAKFADGSAACADALALGATSCSASVATDGAFGFRLGALKKMDGIMVGPSLGYLYGGPDVSGKIDTTSTSPGGPGSSTNKATNNTFRILGEVHKEIAISGPWSADLEAGLGMAVDAETDSCSATGTSVGKAPCSKGPTNGWMTWELSPAIAYKMVSVGVRYEGFARGGFVPWNTFGAFVGARY